MIPHTQCCGFLVGYALRRYVFVRTYIITDRKLFVLKIDKNFLRKVLFYYKSVCACNSSYTGWAKLLYKMQSQFKNINIMKYIIV